VSGAAALAAAFLALSIVGAATGSLERVERDVYLMGTRARLQAYSAGRAEGLAALDRALGVLEATEDELSTWRDHSAISSLNRQPVGEPWHASTNLCASFAELFRWYHASGGTFDPAIGALTDAWGIHDGGRLPSSAVLHEARRASGMRLLHFDRARCTLTRRADVRIDVGAWGKGDAIDRVRRAVPDTPWLIDFGGQIAVNGLPPGEPAWAVSLAHPHMREEEALSLWLRSGSISTSAGSERDLMVRGRRIAHHLDPRTGRPATFNGSVTVWHESALVADTLSTALYVMGPADGLRWATAQHIAVCYLVSGESRVIRRATADFQALLSRPSR
jgi:FAD:protein FMN transferase